MSSKTVFFDDGLKISLQSDTLHIVQNMLCAFRAMSDGAISEQHWNKSCFRLPLPRINMPMQPKSGMGAGSCGVAVMLAIRDIIMVYHVRQKSKLELNIQPWA